MKPKTIGYSHTYPLSSGDFEKIWIELELDDADDVRQALYKAKRIVSDFHFESNKAAEKVKEAEQVETKMPLTKVVDLIKEINFCNDFATLEKVYKYIAATDADIQAAYDKRRAELKQSEIKQLLSATNSFKI